MSLQRSIIIVLASDLAAKIALGVVGLLLIRFVAPHEFALLTFATAIATLASQAFGGSVNRIFILETPDARFAAMAARLVALQMGAVLLVALAGLPFADALPGVYGLTVVLAGGMLLSDFGKTVYQKQLRFGAFSGIELARAAVVASGIGALLLALGYDVLAWQVLAVQGAALWVVSLATAGRHLARTSLSVPLRAPVDRRHGYLLGYFLVLAVFSQVDILMLRILADTDTLASYGSAARYYYLLSLALGAVHTVFLPTMQQVENVQGLDDLFRKHLNLLAGFAPLVAALALLSQWVLPWVDQGRYPEAVPTLQILCLSAVISFAFSPYVNLVFVFRRYRFLFFLIVAALAINVALNVALIPAFGARGAATATLVASACVTVSIFVLSRRLQKAARAAGGKLGNATFPGGTVETR